MIETLIGLASGGPQTLFAGLVAALVAAIALYVKGRRDGGAIQKVNAERARAKSAEDQLEMHREADAIEREIGKLTDEQLDKEIAKWSRPNGRRSHSR